MYNFELATRELCKIHIVIRNWRLSSEKPRVSIIFSLEDPFCKNQTDYFISALNELGLLSYLKMK